MTCVVHNDLLLFESVTPVLGNYKKNDKVWPPSVQNKKYFIGHSLCFLFPIEKCIPFIIETEPVPSHPIYQFQ